MRDDWPIAIIAPETRSSVFRAAKIAATFVFLTFVGILAIVGYFNHNLSKVVEVCQMTER